MKEHFDNAKRYFSEHKSDLIRKGAVVTGVVTLATVMFAAAAAALDDNGPRASASDVAPKVVNCASEKELGEAHDSVGFIDLLMGKRPAPIQCMKPEGP